MLNGSIINNKPLLPVVIGWQAVRSVLALLDTGYTGELTVSPELARELGLSITHTRRVGLGDESNAIRPFSFAMVSLENNKSEQVEVLICPGESKIGVELFKKFGFILEMNFKNCLFALKG